MKKKLLILILAIVCTFTLIKGVKADMGAPTYIPYEAVVSNPAGADVYGYDWVDESAVLTKIGNIAFGEVLTFDYEETFDKVAYGSVYYDSNDGDDNYSSTYIKMSDVKAKTDHLDPPADLLLEDPGKVYVYAEDGVYLYSGPSRDAFEIVSQNIPAGTELTYEYSGDDSNGPVSWVYTTYKGVSGWLYILQYFEENGVANIIDPEISSGTIMTIKDDLYLVSKPTSEKVVSSAIPKGTVLTYKYSFPVIKREYIFVTYKGVSGWLYSGCPFDCSNEESPNYIEKDENRLIILEKTGLALYDKLNDLNSKSKVNLPYKAEIETDYNYYDYDDETGNYFEWYHLTYNGKEYWLLINEETKCGYAHEYNNSYIVSNSSEIEMYSAPEETADIINDKIPNGTKLTAIYYYSIDSDWIYIKYQNQYGWVNTINLIHSEEDPEYMAALDAVVAAELSQKQADLDKAQLLVDKLIDGPEKKDLMNRLSAIKVKKEEPKIKIKTTSKKLTTKEIVYYSIGGSVVLALTAFVTILLINKKKKTKIQLNKANSQTEHQTK